MKSMLTFLTTYNLWANSTFVNLLEKLPEGKMDEEYKSSFNTLRKTLVHIWDAEHIWLQRMKGLSLTDWPSRTLQKESFTFNAFLDNSSAFHDFVSAHPASFYSGNCAYRNLKNEAFTNTYETIILHCMNHSTFHRGQMVTLLRQAGIEEIPATDIIVFQRLQPIQP